MLGRHNFDVGSMQLRLGRRNLGRQGNGATQPDTDMKCRWRLLCLRVFFAENVWELVAAPSESLPTRQNGVQNRDEA